MPPHPILAGLTPQQAEAAIQTGPVLVLAGAGTGKTSTLTAAVAHRIAVKGVAPARILAVTFTNKAATEMAGRIKATLGDRAAPGWIGTFHGLAARQLRAEPEIAGLRPGFDILDADDSRRILRRLLRAKDFASDGNDDNIPSGRDPLKLLSPRLSRFKDNLVTPEEASAYIEELIAQANRTATAIDADGLRASALIYADYQRTLREANAADFGDLLLWTTRAMQMSPAYLSRWTGRFDSIVVDEFQDVNPAQYHWARLFASGHNDIFAVGDDDQAIFSWRGANVGFIRCFTQDFPDARTYRLEQNFRSTGHILAAANRVIAGDRNRLGKTLFTRREPGARVEIVAYRDPEAEAAGLIAEILRRRSEGVGPDEIAILYRNNFVSRPLEEALIRARIPYTLLGDTGFYHRAEIKDALALLRLAVNPDDPQSNEAFRRVINIPARGLGAAALGTLEREAVSRRVSLLRAIDTAPLAQRARTAAHAFAGMIRRIAAKDTASLADHISLLLDGSGYRAMLRLSRAETNEGRLENLAELVQVAGGFHTAQDLLDHAALATSRTDEIETGRIRLMTMHRAKGLEFPHVFLAAFEAGVVPSPYGDYDEERRLAYVALTRGMRRVSISFCGYRRGLTGPSPFISDIPEENRLQGWLRTPPIQNDDMCLPVIPPPSPGERNTRWLLGSSLF